MARKEIQYFSTSFQISGKTERRDDKGRENPPFSLKRIERCVSSDPSGAKIQTDISTQGEGEGETAGIKASKSSLGLSPKTLKTLSFLKIFFKTLLLSSLLWGRPSRHMLFSGLLGRCEAVSPVQTTRVVQKTFFSSFYRSENEGKKKWVQDLNLVWLTTHLKKKKVRYFFIFLEKVPEKGWKLDLQQVFFNLKCGKLKNANKNSVFVVVPFFRSAKMRPRKETAAAFYCSYSHKRKKSSSPILLLFRKIWTFVEPWVEEGEKEVFNSFESLTRGLIEKDGGEGKEKSF